MKRRSSELDATFAWLDRENLRRERRTIDFEPGNRVVAIVDGRPLVDFSSNDYLGLARHPAIAAAMGRCAERNGAGSGASHLVTGHGSEHARLEEELAAFTGRERALLFSCGYMANLAVITTLVGRSESVLLDRLCHASLIDGALLSGARFKRYAHGDATSAESALERGARPVTVVATDGVFSMDGDVGPLAALARTSRAHDAWLVVDDAHGLGVIGATGGGAIEYYGLNAEDVPVLVGTLGKAFGTYGAFVAGSAELIQLLLQKARPYIYTTALPQPVAAAAREALRIAQQESWRRERVLSLSALFQARARAMGIPLLAHGKGNASDAAGTSRTSGPLTPIQPVLMGTSAAALRAQEQLLASGYYVVAIREPTVPRGSARLRVTLSAAHTEAQVEGLVEALSRVCARPDRVQPMEIHA